MSVQLKLNYRFNHTNCFYTQTSHIKSGPIVFCVISQVFHITAALDAYQYKLIMIMIDKSLIK